MLIAAHEAGRLHFFCAHSAFADANAFAAFLVPLRRSEWVIYSKKPFGGPEAVLAYLARYTHRGAISNRVSHVHAHAAATACSAPLLIRIDTS